MCRNGCRHPNLNSVRRYDTLISTMCCTDPTLYDTVLRGLSTDCVLNSPEKSFSYPQVLTVCIFFATAPVYCIRADVVMLSGKLQRAAAHPTFWRAAHCPHLQLLHTPIRCSTRAVGVRRSKWLWLRVPKLDFICIPLARAGCLPSHTQGHLADP